MNNIFVGNLSFQATKEDLVKLFEPFGSVANAVIMERKKGKSRGYGFVDMPDEQQKNAAITALQGKEFMWRVLSVSVVIPKIKGESKSREFRPVKKEWKRPAGESKPFRKDDRKSKSWVKSQSAVKSPRGDFKPAKPWQKNESNAKSPRPESNSEGGSKYYSKFDGPPKPWRQVSRDSKPSRKDDSGSKPYRRDDRAARPESNSEAAKKPYKKFDPKSKPWVKKEGGAKPFKRPGTGFKMSHKVSGIPKAWSKKERIDP
jgi:RNA recognition motif-containing protein